MVVTVTVTISAPAATLGLPVIVEAAGLMTIDRATLLAVASGLPRKEVRRFSGITARVGWFLISLDALSVLDSRACVDKDAGASGIDEALPGAGVKVSEALVMSVVGVLAFLGVSVVFAADGVVEAESVALGNAGVGGVDRGLKTLVELTEEGAFVWLSTKLPLSAETIVVAWSLKDVTDVWLEGFALS